MPAINVSATTSRSRECSANGPLERAALAALRAPSLLNTQPWRWRVRDDSAELSADRSRQLTSIDPDGRLLILSCGIALHHATVALAAMGHRPRLTVWPDATAPDLLAVLRTGGPRQPTFADQRAFQAMMARRTDRRPSSPDVCIPGYRLEQLRDEVERHGAHLHLLRPDQVPVLIVAAAHAARIETADPRVRNDLARWTHRPAGHRDGVTAGTVVPQIPRRVPQREFLPNDDAGLAAGDGDDQSANYAILFGDGDEPADWLAAGQALSALLIAATERKISVNPISNVVEVEPTRATLAGLLCQLGHPMIALRLGVAAATPPPPEPRRPPAEVIDT
ncbi:NAD(P)H nitroreductase [Actinocatenispora thailandica]|uniref:NAD(P)H nitroreductase n=1 Tax=Actinocatenispora thailandica TaxID=227318 RepID=A0A7R7DWR5_9ACTN|nr:nitroreductase [Actinocatenispora thailandica]BCJ39285.1 NAD(P)H nitroreductase [Actinocatenispora thailandica]